MGSSKRVHEQIFDARLTFDSMQLIDTCSKKGEQSETLLNTCIAHSDSVGEWEF